MRITLAVLLCLAGSLAGSMAGCSRAPEEFPDPDLPPVPTNPDGDPYPTDHIGSIKRSGTRPGQRIPNLVFRAYKNDTNHVSHDLETVALADYYDPHEKRNKVLHLQVAATWCAICSSELSATITVTEPLKERGVVFLEVVISGATAGKGPSLDEVGSWIDAHQSNFPTAIDVRGRRLGALGVSTAVVPHDILIDTRTMEILDSSAGAPLDVGIYVEDALRWVLANPPSYP
jgi:hypothetical protein